MTEPSVDERIEIKIGVFGEETADEVATALNDHGATDVDTSTRHGFLPTVPIVIAASIGISGLAHVFKVIRKNRTPRMIIDARVIPLEMRVIEEIRDGKITVILSDDANVEIHDAPPLFDPTEVTIAALESTADAVKSGAVAGRPRPKPVAPRPRSASPTGARPSRACSQPRSYVHDCFATLWRSRAFDL